MLSLSIINHRLNSMKIRNPFNENFTGFKKDATGWEKFGWSSFLASLGGASYEFFSWLFN